MNSNSLAAHRSDFSTTEFGMLCRLVSWFYRCVKCSCWLINWTSQSITDIGIMQVMILVHNRYINCNSFDCWSVGLLNYRVWIRQTFDIIWPRCVAESDHIHFWGNEEEAILAAGTHRDLTLGVPGVLRECWIQREWWLPAATKLLLFLGWRWFEVAADSIVICL
jgi:hypothetical protein